MEVKTGGLGLVCTIKGGPTAVSGKKITLSRDDTGLWTCGQDVATADVPKVVGTSCTGS